LSKTVSLLQENIKGFRCFFRGLIRYNLTTKWAGKKPVVGHFEMAGARTVPVRSVWQRHSLENSPVAFIVERAADGDRPRSGQTDPLPKTFDVENPLMPSIMLAE
jgi:hypothetical protein